MLENIIKILIANGAVLIIPGLNFSLVSRIAMDKGIWSGFITSLGITLGIMTHVMFAMMGSYKIFTQYPALFTIVKWGGVLYILWLALNLCLNAYNPKKSQKNYISTNDTINAKETSNFFRNGYFVDLLNPYVTLFYVSLFSQIMTQDITAFNLSAYGILIFSITILWFSAVALFFSHPVLRKIFDNNKKIIELASALLLIYFALKLAIT